MQLKEKTAVVEKAQAELDKVKKEHREAETLARTKKKRADHVMNIRDSW